MKKMFVFSVLISLTLLCSCQKQDSTLEAQLAQRKVDLDSREQALDQREKELERREQAVADREKAIANSRIIQPKRQAPDAAQAEAERQKRIQQLPPELRALIPDPAQVHAAKTEIPEGERPDPAQLQAERERRMQQLPAEFRALLLNATQMKDRLKQERLDQSQGRPEASQGDVRRKVESPQNSQMSDAAASSAAEITSPTSSPAVEGSSVIASPTPQ